MDTKAKREAFDAYQEKETKTCCTAGTTCVSAVAGKPALRFQYGKKKNGQWYWHIRARNGEIIAEGEGYKREASVTKLWARLVSGCRMMELTKVW